MKGLWLTLEFFIWVYFLGWFDGPLTFVCVNYVSPWLLPVLKNLFRRLASAV